VSNRAISIEFRMYPYVQSAGAYLNFISLVDDNGGTNLAIGAVDGELVLRLGEPDGEAREWGITGARLKEPQQLTISIAEGRARAYLDGKRVFSTRVPTGWLAESRASRLVFGGGWQGAMEGIAVYARALEPEEIEANRELYALRYAVRIPVTRWVVEARLVEKTSGARSETRALNSGLYEVVEQVRGRLEEDRFVAIHWAVMDGEAQEAAARKPGEVYRMILEPAFEHRELLDETVITNGQWESLPVYYNVDS